MIKRIVMMEGGVETLSYFSHQMAQEFQCSDMQYFSMI